MRCYKQEWPSDVQGWPSCVACLNHVDGGDVAVVHHISEDEEEPDDETQDDMLQVELLMDIDDLNRPVVYPAEW